MSNIIKKNPLQLTTVHKDLFHIYFYIIAYLYILAEGRYDKIIHYFDSVLVACCYYFYTLKIFIN